MGSGCRFCHSSWVIRATLCKSIILIQNHNLSLVVVSISIFFLLLFFGFWWLRVDYVILDSTFAIFRFTIFAGKVVGPSKLFGREGILAHVGVFMHCFGCGLRFDIFWLLHTLILTILNLTSSKFRSKHHIIVIIYFLHPLCINLFSYFGHDTSGQRIWWRTYGRHMSFNHALVNAKWWLKSKSALNTTSLRSSTLWNTSSSCIKFINIHGSFWIHSLLPSHRRGRYLIHLSFLFLLKFIWI